MIATSTIIGEVFEASRHVEEARVELARAIDAMDKAVRLAGTGGYHVNQHTALVHFTLGQQWIAMVSVRMLFDGDLDDDGGIVCPAPEDAPSLAMWKSPVEAIKAWFGGES